MKKQIAVLGFVFLSQSLMASCTDFFYVKRPVVLGAVIHEFVASEDQESKAAEAFGLLKGNEDLRTFVTARKNGDEAMAEITFLGTACDVNARAAAKMARDYSQAWSKTYENWVLYLTRMGIAPVIGKPCRNAALEIADALRNYF